VSASYRRDGQSPHDARARFLTALAALLGCRWSIGESLPDELRPDVLRFSITRRLMFIADAMDTETPGCYATRARLRTYVPWLRAHVTSGGSAVFAICFGRAREAGHWLRLIARLAGEAGLIPRSVGIRSFGPGTTIVWLAYLPASRGRARGP